MLAANARPDVSLGYKYNTARDLYAGATPVSADGHFASSADSTSATYYGDSTAHTLASGTADYAATGAAVSTQQANYLGSTASTGATGATSQYTTTGIDGAAAFGTQSATGSGATNNYKSLTAGYSSASSGSSIDSVEASALPPIITKSFYFEAAPEEPEEQHGPRFVSVGRAQKNYKVIFIKAPTYGLNSQIIPVLPQNEEKTIIYVLSKKPELNQDIELPPVPTTEPTKPEIFFVKYKSEQEALDAQHKIKHVYETNQPGAQGDEHYDNDQHIHTIVSEAVPNVYSAAGKQQYQHQQQQKQLIASALGQTSVEQRFGGEVQDEQAAIDAVAQVAGGHNVADTAAGFNVISELVRDHPVPISDSERTEINDSADLISVNFVDLNNAAAVGTAAAALHGDGVANGEHQHVSVVDNGEPEQEYLPPNHEHEQF